MRRILAAAVLALAAVPAWLTPASAQVPPQNLPANTVLGRLGNGTGPVQAIPFSIIGPQLITSYLTNATPTLGVANAITGSLSFASASNSGVVTLTAPNTSTSWTCKLPTTRGSAGQGIVTDGADPCQLSWSAVSGVVNSGNVGQLAWYQNTGAAVTGATYLAHFTTAGNAFLAIGTSGTQGNLQLAGSSSGTTTLIGPATGGGTWTFQAGSDTVVGRASTDTLSNKTLISPTLNSPTMTTPTLGVATATTINKVTITAPATGSTLTIADGKTLTDTSGVGAVGLLGATGGGFTAYAGTSCTNQFVRSLSTAIAATCATVANTDLANSSITIGSTSVALGATAATVAGLTLTAPTINGGTAQALTNLGIRSTGTGAFDLVLANSENLTAQRALTLTLNNAARTISLSGNLSFSAAFTTSGGGAITFNTSGATSVTLPTAGTLATIDQAQTFSSSNIFSALTQFTDIKLSSGKIYPTGDSTTAMQVTKADGSTALLNFDTTNRRTGINKTTPSFDLDVSGTIGFTTLDATSLSTSTSTITGLTANNSPTAANDYTLYWSAADGRIRKITLAALTSASVAGVSSLNGLTGGLSIANGGGLTVSAASTTVTITAPVRQAAGRLTLTTATPVMTASATTQGTLYYDCYRGNTVPYWNGTADSVDTISSCEVSTAMQTSGTGVLNSGGVFDVWWDGNTNHNICVATNGSGGGWASDTSGSNTARGTGYSQLDYTTRPYITNKNAISSCYNGTTNYGSLAANKASYLGTICTDASSAGKVSWTYGTTTANGGAGRFCVWNNYNRVMVQSITGDTTDNWSVGANTKQSMNTSTTNRATYVSGIAEDAFQAQVAAMTLTGGAVVFSGVGIGYDSTSAMSGTNYLAGSAGGAFGAAGAFGQFATTSVGLHFFQALDLNSGGSASTNYGDGALSGYLQGGLTFIGMM